MTEIPFSAACERNKDPILDVIRPSLQSVQSVLEVGSGTAQHAIHFAGECPNLEWQTSDQEEYLPGIRAQLETTQLSNVLLPLTLDVNQPQWIPDKKRFPLIYTANTLHIMAWSDVCAFFSGLYQVVDSSARLIVYGPFKYDGQFTSESNAEFDENLRSRGVGSAIRDFEEIDQLAKKSGFSLLADHTMPANNQCLIWQSNV